LSGHDQLKLPFVGSIVSQRKSSRVQSTPPARSRAISDCWSAYQIR
jgi:hypothetical protein